MKPRKLHTALLEDLFGPIHLRILKQEGEMRMIHLLDGDGISRTLGIVRFKNCTHPVIREAHRRIYGGELLGKTLMEGDIEYSKAPLFQCEISLPEWVRKDFESQKNTAVARYSNIHIEDPGGGEAFLYAEVFEIIPPEIQYAVAPSPNVNEPLDDSCISLLNFAHIAVASNTSNL